MCLMYLLRLSLLFTPHTLPLPQVVLHDVTSFDVVVTTYEMAVSPEWRHVLRSRIFWRFLVLDEGHRIKNEKSEISLAVRKIRSQNKLLLTGTLLQNNLHELWAVLNAMYVKHDMILYNSY